ncbi:MAG: ferrous iron transport protein A [Anaerolineaceae bacterium]|nr:ferrous iron transport protein A [Anaerolineaceae bacterium]
MKIIRIDGGHRMGEKLRQMAIFPGIIVKVLRYAPLGGPVMIEVEGRTVALGRGIARHVQVVRLI